MELGVSLNCLKLQKSFVRQLNEDDFDFAEKQYQKMYAEQMSKLSSKLQKIQRFKRHLKSIQNQQNTKLFDRKNSLNNKKQQIERNKLKYLTQKVKIYKLNHELWDSKIQGIKRKQKEQIKNKFEKVKKYQTEGEQFWKTKTQSIVEKDQALSRSIPNQQKSHRQLTVKDSIQPKKRILPESWIKKSINAQNDAVFNSMGINQSKTVRFLKEKGQSVGHKNENSRTKNESNFSNKLSIKSLKNEQTYPKQSKKSLLMTNLEQHKFSEHLYGSRKDPIIKAIKQNSQGESKIDIQRRNYDHKINISFQKTMKKLEKIGRLKQKHLKKIKISEINIISPSKPRKSIDPDNYRKLRAKSEAKRPNKHILTEQNMEDRQQSYKKVSQQRLATQNASKKETQTKLETVIKLSDSRIHVSRMNKIRTKQQEEQRKITVILENHQQKVKKQKIVRAIKDKIEKIKMEEIRKIRQFSALN